MAKSTMNTKKVKKSTKSGRRFTYQSFKESLDSLSINNATHSLSKRLETEIADDSFFYVEALGHWKEINISKNFSEYCRETHGYTNSLAQLLYHKKQVFSQLKEYIGKHDNLSLEPLLDLLVNFVHDLGEEFMEFYEEAMAMLIDLAVGISSTNSNDNATNQLMTNGNVVQWCFTAVAFIFKHLSKVLARDVVPTLRVFLPCLKLGKKPYIVRFASEAISYLFKKAPEASLSRSIGFLQAQLAGMDAGMDAGTPEIQTFKNSIVIILSDSVKNVSNAYHNRALASTLALFLQLSFNSEDVKPQAVLTVCDLLLILVHHGTVENVGPIYEIVLGHLDRVFANDHLFGDDRWLAPAFQVLATLVFADAGRKCARWDLIEKTSKLLVSKVQRRSYPGSLYETIGYFFATVVRNAPMEFLAKFHSFVFHAMLSLDQGNWFLAFAESSIVFQREKTLIFGSKIISDFLVKHWKTHQKQIAAFLSHVPPAVLAGGFKHAGTAGAAGNKLSVQITAAFYSDLVAGLAKSVESSADQHLLDVYWRLLVLKHSNKFQDYRVLLSLFVKFSGQTSGFSNEIAGHVLQTLSKQQISDPDSLVILQTAINTLTVGTEQLKDKNSSLKSKVYIAGFLSFVESISTSNNATINHLKSHSQSLIQSLSFGLTRPCHQLRSDILRTIAWIFIKTGQEVPDILNKMQSIEDLPTTLPNSREIALKIRQLASLLESANTGHPVAIRWVFGLLNTRFKPVWDSILENIDKFARQNEDSVWDLVCYFLYYNYNHIENDGELEFAKEPQQLFNLLDHRVNDSFSMFSSYFHNYMDVDRFLMDHAKKQCTNAEFTSFIRYQCLQILLKVPSLAEKKARYLVPLIFRETEEQVDDTSEENVQTIKKINYSTNETNLLIDLLAKFKNIKNIHQSGQLYNHILKLLCSKTVAMQKAALKVVFAYKNKEINRFSDNLNNIIDDSTFRDEIVTFFSDNSAEDLAPVMPVMLRILYGKSKVKPTGNSKQGKKNAIFKSLIGLPETYIVQFVQLGYEEINYKLFFDEFNAGEDAGQLISKVMVTDRLVRKMNGFVNFVGDFTKTFQAKYVKALESALLPLLYSIAIAQYCADVDSRPELSKSVRIIRQTGLRDLNLFFNLLGPNSNFNWSPYHNVIYTMVMSPRLTKFSVENLQLPSSMMRIIVKWSSVLELYEFLYFDDYRPVRALLELFGNPNCKSIVLSEILDFCINVIDSKSIDKTVAELVLQDSLKSLPKVFGNQDVTKEVVSKVVQLILMLLDQIHDHDTIMVFITMLVDAFDKSNLDVATKTAIVTAVARLLANLQINNYTDIQSVYVTCSRALKVYKDASLRTGLLDVLAVIGEKLPEFKQVASVLKDMNSHSHRLQEPDYVKRIEAYNMFNNTLYSKFGPEQWYPFLYNSLFFMSDSESGIRSNARYVLCRFVDAATEANAASFVHWLKDVVLPNLRVGIRNSDSKIQKEYVELLAHIVEHSKYYTGLADMKVLLHGNDEEANFFLNINHIQVHRIQRAVRRLTGLVTEISGDNIAHYLIPMVEKYVYCSNDNLRNVSNDAIATIGVLTRHVSWNQYRALIRRYVSYLKKTEFFRDVVRLVVSCSNALSVRTETDKDGIKQEEIDSFIILNLFPQLNEILLVRDEETAVYRVMISESMVALILCLSEDKRAVELPGVLTKVSQVLRSRSEELRDSVRKSLGKIVSVLGTRYLRFVLKELKSALRLGPQIHILSFTVHYLLVCLNDTIKHGLLDESSDLIMEIIMEDVFGAASLEKDVAGYSAKTKEVKHNKSYDTAEILARYTELTEFAVLLKPIKLLLNGQISLRTQNRLDELLRRFTLGLNHNTEAASSKALMLCYSIFMDSNELFKKKATKSEVKQTEEHFLVQLDAKPVKSHTEFSVYSNTLKKFALELLRTVLSRNGHLVTFENLSGFIPLLERSLKSDNEGLMIAALKVMNYIILLPLDEPETKLVTVCARRVLQLFKNCPSTNSDLAQSCLRFLSLVIRHKNQDVQLKTSATSYILVKLMPDLEDPNRQGLAFNLLKAVLSQHIYLPELYDVMEKVSKIMVTNHTQEIRNMARSTYFQFLMEYDQGKGKLDKEFATLIANLSYPAESGRLTVLELINSLIIKAPLTLLSKIATSFFVSLSHVSVFDESIKCRELACEALTGMLGKLGSAGTGSIETYLVSWVRSSNPMLVRCGLQMYKLYISSVGLGINAELDQLVAGQLKELFRSDDNDEDSNWELIYTGLGVFAKTASLKKDSILKNPEYCVFWPSIVNLLLFPHSWVRLSAARLLGILLSNLKTVDWLTAQDIQTIAYRSTRQLSAPKITLELGNQAVKNLVFIAIHWNQHNAVYEKPTDQNQPAIVWLISKITAIIRNDYKSHEFVNSKVASIKLTAMVVQILSADQLRRKEITEPILLALFNFAETDDIDPQDSHKLELHQLAVECLKILESKLGLSDYSQMFANVRRTIADRRVERKVKRAQMKVTNPEAAAKRSLKKHAKTREKRKLDKDENGYYHGRKKQRS